MAWYGVVDELWIKKIAEHGEPQYMSELLEVDYSALAGALQRQDAGPFAELVEPLSQGAFLLVRNAFSAFEVAQLKEISMSVRSTEAPSFSKILEGCPNFWRDITEVESKNYAIKNIKKTSYFFPWNSGSDGLFELVNPRYRVGKLLAGLPPRMYERNTPKDGVVDRIQIVEYPAGTGQIQPHKDPKHSQRLIMSGYLSKQGTDYEGGGFGAQNANGEKQNLENAIEVGDMGVCYAEITHGVDATDAVGPNGGVRVSGNIESAPGSRWFLGLYATDSDENSVRITSRPIQLKEVDF